MFDIGVIDTYASGNASRTVYAAMRSAASCHGRSTSNTVSKYIDKIPMATEKSHRQKLGI